MRVNNAGFPRARRLTRQADFQAIFAAPDCKSIDACFVVLARRTSESSARLGLAISKRKIKHAVQRNRLKRLIRESFRQWQPPLPALDIVILAQAAAADASNQILSASLARHWPQLLRRCAAH